MQFELNALLPFVNVGVAGTVLVWFMFRLEKVLGKLTRQIRLNSMAIIRLVERHDPEAAQELSKELYRAEELG